MSLILSPHIKYLNVLSALKPQLHKTTKQPTVIIITQQTYKFPAPPYYFFNLAAPHKTLTLSHNQNKREKKKEEKKKKKVKREWRAESRSLALSSSL